MTTVLRVQLIALMTIALYVPVLGAPLLYEDLSWWTVVHAGDWVWRVPGRGLTLASYAVMPEASSLVLRSVGLGLHLVVGGLVGMLAWQLTRSSTAAWLAMAISLWHPLQSQAVLYASARSDLLLATCTLVAVVVAGAGRAPWRWLVVGVALVGALSSKEIGIIAPALVLLTWARTRRVFWLVGGAGLAVIAWVVLTRWFWLSTAVLAADSGVLLEQARITALGVWRLLRLVVVPVGLSFDPDPWAVGWWWSIVALGSLGGLVTAAWVCRRSAPLTAWAIGWVAISVAPRFISATGEPLHEHQWYLAMAGVSVALGAGLAALRAAPAPRIVPA